MTVRFIKQVCYSTAVIFCTSLHANIDNLKGTFDILKDEYKQFSILNGAIADQTGYLMHLYDYGTFGQSRMDKTVQPPVAVPDISNAPDAVKLVHLFFHRAPGTIGRGDFVFTVSMRKASENEKKDIIKAIAWMMGQAKQLEIIVSGSRKAEAVVNRQIKAIGLKDLDIRNELAHLAYLAHAESSVSITDMLERQPEMLKVFKLVWQAMQQERGSKAIFPQYTTNTVLLGIVYRLADSNKSSLKIFYEKLNEVIIHNEHVSSIFVNDVIPANWVNEHFKPADRQRLIATLNFSAADIEKLKQHYESIVYLALLPGDLPQEAGFTVAAYQYDPNNKNKIVEFTDCMETALLRNIINLLLYDKDNMVFKFAKFSVNPVQPLKDFYTKNSEASDTESKYLHNEWAQVAENIPFVAYRCKVGDDRTATDLGKKIGYIKVPQGTRLSDDYIPVGPDAIVYEARVSIRNFIVFFNYLFQLNLFDDEKGNTSEEKMAIAFVRPDFIKTYFPRLCTKLGILFNGFFEGDKDVTEIIDSKDYGLGITTKLIIDSVNVNLTTEPGHCFINTTMKESPKTDPFSRWLDFIMQVIFDPSKNYFEEYFSSFPYVTAHMNKDNWDAILNSKIDAVHMVNLLFYLPINNPDYVKNLIAQLDRLKIQLNENAIKLLFYLANNVTDEKQRQLLKLDLNTIMVRCSEWQTQAGLPGFKNSSSQELIKLASAAAQSETSNARQFGLKLLEALVEKEQAYSEAIQAATGSVQFPSWSVRRLVLRLFEALFEKGQGYSVAIQSAIDAIKNKDEDTKSFGCQLLIMIVKRLNSFPFDKLVSELKTITKQAIEAGKSVDTSASDGQKILQMVKDLEKKIEKK